MYTPWTLPNTSTFRSFIQCLVNDIDIFDDETGFNVERVIKQFRSFPDPDPITEVELREVVNKCADKNDVYASDVWVYTGLKCFLNEAKRREMKDEEKLNN